MRARFRFRVTGRPSRRPGPGMDAADALDHLGVPLMSFAGYWLGLTAVWSITLLVAIVREFPKNRLTLPGKIVALGAPVGGAMAGTGRAIDAPTLAVVGLVVFFGCLFATRLFVRK
jgi:hypothetical protein